MNRENFKDHFEPGSYNCGCCDQELFLSHQKIPSTGRHPNFRRPVRGAVAVAPDLSITPTGTKVVCSGCGQILGRLHNNSRLLGDTQPDAGLRFEVFSRAIKFGAAAQELKSDVGILDNSCYREGVSHGEQNR